MRERVTHILQHPPRMKPGEDGESDVTIHDLQTILVSFFPALTFLERVLRLVRRSGLTALEWPVVTEP